MTIREHAEAIRSGHSACGNCEHGVICSEVEHAQAILDALDVSPAYEGIRFYPTSAGPGEPMRARLVPDPEVRA